MSSIDNVAIGHWWILSNAQKEDNFVSTAGYALDLSAPEGWVRQRQGATFATAGWLNWDGMGWDGSTSRGSSIGERAPPSFVRKIDALVHT